ncbi:hypothetical protein Pmani_018998 [Petrolisthes manimaculis]|uniref:Uncharacterized protein n=1 Tax=Petrolisthes manimaculis TaxID=1843537 RepID=A0AAE1U7V8_9EUCA|nr:hypothetical protein Pmani_018998 [Petrolisthes manimaculis]
MAWRQRVNRGPSNMATTDIIILWEENMNNAFQGEPLGECVEQGPWCRECPAKAQGDTSKGSDWLMAS